MLFSVGSFWLSWPGRPLEWEVLIFWMMGGGMMVIVVVGWLIISRVLDIVSLSSM